MFGTFGTSSFQKLRTHHYIGLSSQEWIDALDCCSACTIRLTLDMVLSTKFSLSLASNTTYGVSVDAR